jgi:hypothetical protein
MVEVGTAPTQDQPDGSSRRLRNPENNAAQAMTSMLACCMLFNPNVMFQAMGNTIDPGMSAAPSFGGLSNMMGGGFTRLLASVSSDIAAMQPVGSALNGGQAQPDPRVFSTPGIQTTPAPRGPSSTMTA